MLDGMTLGQWREWQEFAREEPFGFIPQSELAALLACVTANSAPFRGGSAVPLDKFRWRPGVPPKDEAAEAVDGMGASLGAAEPAGPDLSRPYTG